MLRRILYKALITLEAIFEGQKQISVIKQIKDTIPIDVLA